MCGSISKLILWFYWYICLSFARITLWITVALSRIWNQTMSLLTLFLFFKIIFGYSGFFAYQNKFWNELIHLYRNILLAFLLGLHWVSRQVLGRIDILIILSLSQYISPFIYIFFDFFHQCFVVISIQVLHFLLDLHLYISCFWYYFEWYFFQFPIANP